MTAIETTCNACLGAGGWGSGQDAEHCMQCDTTGKVAIQDPRRPAAIKSRTPNFAHSRDFLDRLPAERDTNLAELARLLGEALDYIHRVQCQRAVGYVSKEALDALAGFRNGVGVSIFKQPLGDRVPVFAEPSAAHLAGGRES